MRVPTVAIAAGAILCVAAAAEAAKLTVPTEEYPTLQSAVDAANEGDVISVKPGLPTGGVLLEGKKKLKILGSRGATLDGAGEVSYVLHLVDCEDILVQGLDISDGTQQGIRITSSTRVRVTKCVIRSNSNYGVKVRAGSTDVRIDKCVFHDNGAYSVYVTNSGSDGAPTTGVRVSGNAMEGAGEGVRFDSPGVIVEKNRITGAGDFYAVVSWSPSATDGLVSKNRIEFEEIGPALGIPLRGIELAQNYGIRIQGEGTRVEKNRLAGPAVTGIMIYAADCRVVGNIVEGTLDWGMVVEASGATVTGNRVIGSGIDGYLVAGNGGTYSKNLSDGAGSAGFRVQASQNTFEKNTAKDSGTNGLDDSTGTGGNTYIRNRFGTENIHSDE